VSEVSGKVVSVAESFDVGQIFAKGDVLLKIDARDYELALAQARSQVAQAQLRLQMEVKEADVVRREWELLNQGEPTGLQAREPQLASARAALEAALAAEEAAKRNLDRCEIRAPFDGMVARAGVRPGQFAALATPLGELFATDVSEVRLPLSANDLSFIDLPKGYDTRVDTGFTVEGGVPTGGYVIAFGARARKCFAFLYTTRTSGPDAEAQISERLAVMQTGVLEQIEQRGLLP
jgi:multidrug resistance efflux pump